MHDKFAHFVFYWRVSCGFNVTQFASTYCCYRVRRRSHRTFRLTLRFFHDVSTAS